MCRELVGFHHRGKCPNNKNKVNLGKIAQEVSNFGVL